jgi:uncharacterized membrane protein YeaQ/YmgE (transglycosylase-associated protein family)
MDLILVLGWLIYGVVIGLIVKSIYKGAVPSGFLSTILVGVCGSFLGGFIRYLITGAGNPFQSSGVIMGILGGVSACYLYKKIKEL